MFQDTFRTNNYCICRSVLEMSDNRLQLFLRLLLSMLDASKKKHENALIPAQSQEPTWRSLFLSIWSCAHAMTASFPSWSFSHRPISGGFRRPHRRMWT